MGDNLVMSKRERQRKVIVEQVLAGHLTRLDAAIRLGVSYRHVKRIIAAYRRAGDAGLVHKHRGCTSGRAYPLEVKEQVLALYREKYLAFGPTFAAEKLEEEAGVTVHPETLRLWLKATGLWEVHRQRKAHRSRRKRRTRYGELLQLDGSIHSWFAQSDEKQCLMNMVDDATSKTLALMDEGETTRAAFSLLNWWVTNAGIPLAIYVDLKSLYVSPKSLKKKLVDGEELVEVEWLTHFSKACKKLGITIIKAYSPQAKGRVERSHGIYQDRLVKELKLKNITTIDAANKYLSDGFVNQLNEKFAKPASAPEDAHVPLMAGNDLDQILCWEFERQVKNDWTVQLEGQHYQIEKTQRVSPKQKLLVRKHLDGSVSLWCKDERLKATAIEARPVKALHDEKKASIRPRSQQAHSPLASTNKHKSPWSQFNPGWLSSPKSKREASV